MERTVFKGGSFNVRARYIQKLGPIMYDVVTCSFVSVFFFSVTIVLVRKGIVVGTWLILLSMFPSASGVNIVRVHFY